jgi:outer membrane protein assembly factor BamB
MRVEAFDTAVAVGGSLAVIGETLVAGREDGGVVGIDRRTGLPRWERADLPPLAGAGDSAAFAYARTGLLVALDAAGCELWRAALSDDRAVPARHRGDKGAPFVADVLAMEDYVYVAAGREVIRLRLHDGLVDRRMPAAPAERGVVARLAAAHGLILASCTQRTPWDEEQYPSGGLLWQPPVPLEARRVHGAELAACDLDLRERWRRPAPAEFVYGNVRPVATDADAIACTALHLKHDGEGQPYVDLFQGAVLLLDAASGSVRWQRSFPDGGSGQHDPVAVVGGVVVGLNCTRFDVADGRQAWALRADAAHIDNRVQPMRYRDALLTFGNGAILAIAARDGSVREVARLAESPFHGHTTTELLVCDDTVYIGWCDAGGTTRLSARPLGAP